MEQSLYKDTWNLACCNLGSRMMFEIHGKVALVTGGVAGIGLCIIKELLRNGAKVSLLLLFFCLILMLIFYRLSF